MIINDVDVSGCDFYDKNKKYCLTLKMDTRGFKNPSCFSGDFQKCIQDSKVCPNTFCDNNPNCYYKQLAREKQECEELKKQIKIIDDETIVVEITEKQFEEYKKLKQTLTEIKEIALGVRNYLACPSPRDVRYEMDIILQKIRKCEVNDA